MLIKEGSRKKGQNCQRFNTLFLSIREVRRQWQPPPATHYNAVVDLSVTEAFSHVYLLSSLPFHYSPAPLQQEPHCDTDLLSTHFKDQCYDCTGIHPPDLAWHSPLLKTCKIGIWERICIFTSLTSNKNQYMQNNLLLLMANFRKLCFFKANVGKRF